MELLTLTDSLAKRIKPEPQKRIHFDSYTRGLGVMVYPTGNRSWVYLYSFHGYQRKITIGPVSAWPIAQVREYVNALRRKIDQGVDPMEERLDVQRSPTVEELAREYAAEHLSKLARNTQQLYLQLLELRIIPDLGKRKVIDVTTKDIQKLHDKFAEKVPITANRMVAVIQAMFKHARDWRSDNPAVGVKLCKETPRERFLTGAELARLGAALDETGWSNAIRLMLFTGSRVGETLAAEWKDFDLENGVWTKPASTTKTGRKHRVPLSGPAVLLLQNMKERHDGPSDRVFVTPYGRPIERLDSVWRRIRREAKIEDVRVHDLRHTYASLLVQQNMSLQVVGKLIGHSQVKTTERYAHLDDRAMRDATELVGKVVGNVVELRRKRA